jgi:hypothetical protein
MVAATFLDFLWSLIIIFFMVVYFMILFQVIIDIFRRHDASGFTKTLWLLFLLFAPAIGLIVYLITNGDGMGKRKMEAAQAQQAEFDSYVRQTAASSGSADEIAKAKALLDAGTITQAEFDAIKAKALA